MKSRETDVAHGDIQNIVGEDFCLLIRAELVRMLDSLKFNSTRIKGAEDRKRGRAEGRLKHEGEGCTIQARLVVLVSLLMARGCLNVE